MKEIEDHHIAFRQEHKNEEAHNKKKYKKLLRLTENLKKKVDRHIERRTGEENYSEEEEAYEEE